MISGGAQINGQIGAHHAPSLHAFGGLRSPSLGNCRAPAMRVQTKDSRWDCGRICKTTRSAAEPSGAARHCITARHSASHSGISGQSLGQQSCGIVITGAETASLTNAKLGCANKAPTSKAIIKSRVLIHMGFDMMQSLPSDNTHCAEVQTQTVKDVRRRVCQNRAPLRYAFRSTSCQIGDLDRRSSRKSMKTRTFADSTLVLG